MGDQLGPRVVIAGTHSGVGKTTIATGLMAAFAAAGCRVGAAKVGPDYIDPGYHALAVGRPSRNLDPWMCGEDHVTRGAARAGDGCDLTVIEGVMGLFDGYRGGWESSTAHVASILGAPMVLVVDAASMSRSVAALVHGFATFDPGTRIAGLILNRVGSDSHEAMLRDALAPVRIPIVGVLRRDDGLRWRDRHLGLVPVIEDRTTIAAALARLAERISAGCDLAAIQALAAHAPPVRVAEASEPPEPSTARIALAGGAAFSFTYPDNIEALQAAGATITPFDPLHDRALPDGTEAVVAGGGFPEVYGGALADNAPLLADVRAAARRGMPIWAECGGLLWLAQALDGRPMAGVVEARARMTSTLSLGYRSAFIRSASPIGPPGTEFRGHEFHYSTTDPPGDALAVEGRAPTGFTSATLLASYVHAHLGNRPDLAAAFVRAAGSHRYDGQPVAPASGESPEHAL